jgi:ATP-binding cassette subfamily F protein 3
MIQLVNISHRFGKRELFRVLNWQIRKRDRIALIGPNGAGKTTLFRMIIGEVQPQEGEIICPKGTTMGYLPQDGLHVEGRTLFDEAMTAFAEALEMKAKITEIEHTLPHLDHATVEYESLLRRYGELQHQFEDMGGFRMEAETAKVLHGLGFTNEDFQKMTDEFSGGWQMRIALAKLLLRRHNLLLLDEPTNHLDLDSIQWLEEYLSEYEGAVVIISHDRYFIDRICDRIAELDHKKITDYHGNYEDYEEQKALRQEQLLAAFEQQQSDIRRIELFIERFRYKATKARQVQSRIKMLDRMDKIELPDEDRKVVKFEFPQPPRSGRMVLELKGIAKQYDDKLVFKDLDYTLYRGDRIALVGINGAGKSTLSRLMAGVEEPTMGSRTMGHNVRVEYFAQQQAERLSGENTVYEELESVAGGQTMQTLRTILGAFLFSGDDVLKKVAVLSGGEKARLALAKMLLDPANFFVLDEPTNHIDVQTKDILKAALLDYDGTFIIASHDRYFLDGLVNKVLEIKDGCLTEYLGGFSEYLDKKKAEHEREAALDGEDKTKETDNESGKKSKEQKRLEAEERQKLSVERSLKRKQIEEIESRIHAAEARKSELDALLAAPEVYQDSEKARALVTEYRQLMDEIPLLYQEWERIADDG